ncbi:heat shock 70 kDa protein 15-like protein [Tanacetum coccineum]
MRRTYCTITNKNRSIVLWQLPDKGEFVLNDESKRDTPALVCFGEKQRFFGTAGVPQECYLSDQARSVSWGKKVVYCNTGYGDGVLRYEDDSGEEFEFSTGLHPLPLMRQTTATALAYRIYNDLPENEQLNVTFVDVEHASMQHFAAKYKVEYKIDVLQNTKASLRLRAACEKLKNLLSANPEAPINIKPIEKDLAEAQLIVVDIYAVEVVNCNQDLDRILWERAKAYNERKSKRASLFQLPLTWKGAAQDSQNEKVWHVYSSMQYADVSELKAPPNISTYTIGPFQSTKGERSKSMEEEEVDVPVAEESTKMDTDVPATNEPDVNMQDASGTENGAAETGDNAAQMDTDAKVEVTKKVKISNGPVSALVYGTMLHEEVQKAVEE